MSDVMPEEGNHTTMIFGIALLLIALGIFGFYMASRQSAAEQAAIGERKELLDNCVRWSQLGCEYGAVAQLNADLARAGQKTLEKLCEENFPDFPDPPKAGHHITFMDRCHDMCLNACNPVLETDLAIAPTDIVIAGSTAKIKVWNRGTATAENIDVDVYVAGNRVRYIINKLVPQSSDEHTLSVGDKRDIIVVVDPEYKIEETNEDNNRASTVI